MRATGYRQAFRGQGPLRRHLAAPFNEPLNIMHSRTWLMDKLRANLKGAFAVAADRTGPYPRCFWGGRFR